MNLSEEFKLWETLWEIKPLNEWKTMQSAKGTAQTSVVHPSTSPQADNGDDKVYVTFNYSTANSLDSFWAFDVYRNKSEACKGLLEIAEDRVSNFVKLNNLMVCYAFDLKTLEADYEITIDELEDAVGEGGQNLHYDYTDVCYCLSGMAETESPVFKLSIADIGIEYYEEFISQNQNTLPYDIDDFYDNRDMVVEKLNNDPNIAPKFKKFVTSKLTATITKALP
jgi:hypothetical protein